MSHEPPILAFSNQGCGQTRTKEEGHVWSVAKQTYVMWSLISIGTTLTPLLVASITLALLVKTHYHWSVLNTCTSPCRAVLCLLASSKLNRKVCRAQERIPSEPQYCTTSFGSLKHQYNLFVCVQRSLG